MLHAHSVCHATAMYEPVCGCPVRQEVRRGEVAPPCPLCRRGIPWRLHGFTEARADGPSRWLARPRARGLPITLTWLVQQAGALVRLRAPGWQAAARECARLAALHARRTQDPYLGACALRLDASGATCRLDDVLPWLEAVVRKLAFGAHA